MTSTQLTSAHEGRPEAQPAAPAAAPPAQSSNRLTAPETQLLTSDAGQQWTVRALDGPVPADLDALRSGLPAQVPGEVHTDLMAAGLVLDVFDGDNESALAWVGRTSWRWSTQFTWHGSDLDVHELVLTGVDTVATTFLNGTQLGSTADEHLTHRFEVTSLLREGTNELVIEVAAPVEEAERRDRENARPHVNHHPFNAVRKMASSFGWDWGVDVAGSGLRGPVQLESWSAVRLAAVRPLAGVVDGRCVLDVHADTAWASTGATGEVELVVEVAGVRGTAVVEPGSGSTCMHVQVDGAELWWPRGHGAQPLYEATVILRGAADSGEEHGRWQGRVGFRTTTLDTAPDEHGSPFTLSVNGEPVYVRGANWIPDDALMSRLTRQSYRSAVADAVDAGMNLLRVWGGGIYESEDFYDACDEAGVLVWQDFAFACAAYAEEDLAEQVEAEARQAVTRLSAHASLALWNGCNENIWGYVEWGWRPQLQGATWGEGFYFDLLPHIVAELDPRTPYSPGSPFSFSPYLHPNDAAHGTMHIWDVWNQRDYADYREHRPRFAAEFGFQGPPAWSTLTAVVHDVPLDPYGAQMLVHQKADDGNGKLERGLGEHLPRWKDIDGWHWATQLNQARAVAFAVEHFRSLHPYNTGAVVWQLNDDWPVVSWAAVDSAGIRKPLWHALQRAYADVLVTVQPRDGEPVVVVHNDSPTGFTARLRVSRRSTGAGSRELAHAVVEVEVPARTAVTSTLPTEITTPNDAAAEVLVVASTDRSAVAWWYFVEDTSLKLTSLHKALETSVARTEAGYDVTVTARALVKDLALFPDRLDPAARVDSCLVTLLAGEQHVFHVTCGPLEEESLVRVPVLRSVNDLVL